MERQGPAFRSRTAIRDPFKYCKGDAMLSTPLGDCETDNTRTSNQDVQGLAAARRSSWLWHDFFLRGTVPASRGGVEKQER